MAKIKKKTTDEKRRNDVKHNMKRMRERIKADPEKYEEQKRKERERYHRRKEKGKIKTIKELSDREKRKVRKLWRQRSKRYRITRKKFTTYLDDNTPPVSPRPESFNDLGQEARVTPTTSRQAEQGRRLARRNREELKREIERLNEKVESYRRTTEKYKKRYFRYKKKNSNPNSPTKKVEELMKNNPKDIKRNLLLGEVIARQVKDNFKEKKSIKEKHAVIGAISGPLMRKYKFQHVVSSFSSRMSRDVKTKDVKLKGQKNFRLKSCIKEFLETDESSRILPGKKDTITKQKCKKQKRVLNGSLFNLHLKFKKKYPQYKNLSYSTFCRYRPFWILIPNAKSRETCLCILHENMTLIVGKLRLLNVINTSFPDQLCKELCCNNQLDENCLARTCLLCKGRQIVRNEFNPDQKITYKEWKTKKEKFVVKGVEKMCQKTVKEEIESTCGQLLFKLETSITKYMSHLRNIYHQYRCIDSIKANISEQDVFVHMDFSENYNCKYSQEVQSAHFGGSKPQVSLHTVVAYYKNSETKSVDHVNFCTISNSLRHDPAVICAHLEPVFLELRTLVPNIREAHFLSDGPSTQYRNKKMFHLIASHIPSALGSEKIYWHFSERGHGKGAPDGIGGAVKRTADSAVAHGIDVSSYDDLASVLKNHCKKIRIHNIPEDKIAAFDALVPDKLKTFHGTMQVHQLYWSKQSPEDLQCRSLTCINCDPCPHYYLGTIKITSCKL